MAIHRTRAAIAAATGDDLDPVPTPEFAAVPRKYRHDGWTAERQRAFILALADTGSVKRAANQVNMTPEGAYYLRRQPGAEEFRRAWEAALDLGVQRLKDIAFERAVEGALVPVFVAGKLMGFRRKHNDRLLMFCLRMNARAEDGRRLSATYFRRRPDGGTETASLANLDRAEKDDVNAALIAAFDAVPQSEAGLAAINDALAAEARARESDPQADPDQLFLPFTQGRDLPWAGELEPPVQYEEYIPFREDEPHWKLLADPAGLDEIDRVAKEVRRAVAARKAGEGDPKPD